MNDNGLTTRLGIRPLPIGKHADPPAVLDHESGNIDRVAGRVLAPPAAFAAVEPAARIGPKMLDARHTRAEQLFGSRLYLPLEPQFEPGSDGASRRR